MTKPGRHGGKPGNRTGYAIPHILVDIFIIWFLLFFDRNGYFCAHNFILFKKKWGQTH